jgi:hypothetical protein
VVASELGKKLKSPPRQGKSPLLPSETIFESKAYHDTGFLVSTDAPCSQFLLNISHYTCSSCLLLRKPAAICHASSSVFLPLRIPGHKQVSGYNLPYSATTAPTITPAPLPHTPLAVLA